MEPGDRIGVSPPVSREGRGAAAVFDPIGASTFETSLQLLAPRGCLINYGELSGAVPDINLYQLFLGSFFVTKYNGMHWVEGFHEFAALISDALTLATRRPAVICDIAGRLGTCAPLLNFAQNLGRRKSC